MWTTAKWFRAVTACAAVAVVAATASESRAADPAKPVAGKQVRFPKGHWSALPQVGPDGKVRQCVLVARRSRAGRGGAISTNLSVTIGRGAGLAIAIIDGEVPPGQVLDDQAEILLDDGPSFPAVGFTVGPNGLAMHPGDAAGVLSARGTTVTLTLRSDGAGVDTGPISLDLPGAALTWLKRCGTMFDIAIERPSDPAAPALPAPRPRSTSVSSAQPAAAGLADIADKRKSRRRAASEPAARALYKAGFDARVAGDYDAAIRLLSEAIATGKLNDNDRGTSYNNRGMAFAAKGQHDKAIADYSMAIKVAPFYGPAYLNRGNVYAKQGKLDAAIADYDLAIRISASYELAYNSRGAAYYRKGELDAALADLDTAIRLKPDYGNAYWNRARVHHLKGDTPKTLADFAEAIRLKPKEPEIYTDRGNLRSAHDDNAGAIADYTMAIKLDPNVPLPYNNRGNSHFSIGEIDKAMADFDSAIRLAPSFPDPVISRGRIALFHGGGPAAAMEDLANGVRLAPKDIYAAIWLHIARSRTGTEDRQELATNAERLGPGPWPRPVLDLFLGNAAPDAVRRAATEAKDERTRREQLCEADFYLGMFHLEKKAGDDARKFIAAAADNCPADMLEKPAAKAELARWSQ